MTKLEKKFKLYQDLQGLGFTWEESVALRRIEMTLHRWAEAECNGEIERHETTGKPERVSRAHINGYSDKRTAWPVADREAGALKRLGAIVAERNDRIKEDDAMIAPQYLFYYHQTDPRGCALYLVTREQLSGNPIDQVYYRGLAVCA